MTPDINELQDIIELMRTRMCERFETGWHCLTHEDSGYSIELEGYVMTEVMDWDPVVKFMETDVWKLACTSATFYDDDSDTEIDITDLVNRLI